MIPGFDDSMIHSFIREGRRGRGVERYSLREDTSRARAASRTRVWMVPPEFSAMDDTAERF